RIRRAAMAAPEGPATEISESLGEAGLSEDGNARARNHFAALGQRQPADASLAPAEMGERRGLVQTYVIEASNEGVPIARTMLIDANFESASHGSIPFVLMRQIVSDAHGVTLQTRGAKAPARSLGSRHGSERSTILISRADSGGSGPLRDLLHAT